MITSRPNTSGNMNHLSRPSTRADSRRSSDDVFVLQSNNSISDISILGTEFAQTMIAVNSGVDLGFLESKAEYKAFKKSIFDDTAVIPALHYNHLPAYGIDAQVKESERAWSRAGKKFSDEPRIGKTGRETPGGPDKRDEFKFVFEKPIKVFGRNRVIAKPRKYERSLSRGAIIPYKPSHDEEYAHLGPGTYTPHTDIWREHERLICGIKQGSPIFKSPGRYELPSGLGLGSTLENDSIVKKKIKQQASICRPLTSQERSASTFTHTPTNIKTLSLVADEKSIVGKSAPMSSIDMGWDSSFAEGSISTFTSPVRIQTASIASRSLKTAERLAVAKKSREPGFKFLAGKMGPSAIDKVTGTTNADLHYRRIISDNGELKIMPFYGKNIELPRNSMLVETWATSQEMAEKDEKLQVITMPVGSPSTPSSPVYDTDNNNSIQNSFLDNNDKPDDQTYVSTADFSQEMRYTEELSTSILEGRLSSLAIQETNNPQSPTGIPRSLPSSATLEQPVRRYGKGEWQRPKTVSRADEKRKLLQRKFLAEVKNNNNNYTDMQWNHSSPSDKHELLVPLRVADSMPILPTHNPKLKTKKVSRGGGDVLGSSKGKQKLGTYSFLTENTNLLAEGFI